jgi:signal transduction histidine kinase
VAREVHDGLIQTAIAAHMRLQAFFDDHPPRATIGEGELDLLLDLVRRTVEEARRVFEGLRPAALDDYGLAAPLRPLAEELRADGWRVDYQENLGTERLPEEVETALYRVAQEALTNARKHANTTRARVRLERQEKIRLEIRDFGRGFEPSAAPEGGSPGERVGVGGMPEWIMLLNGDFELRSHPGKGTTVVAEVPLPPPREHTPDEAPKTYRLLLAEDHTPVREGMRSMLERQPDLEVVGEAQDGEEALQMCRSLDADLILMDVRRPKLDGLARPGR